MQIARIPAGTYIVAVSGGVDSVVLLDLLARQKDAAFVVAHFDHGTRPDSADDAMFVAGLAAHYQLPFMTERRELGPTVSEEDARRARYSFLERIKKKKDADAIITAHHQDDALETAIINLMRGTGWRGLCSLRDTAALRRPLLTVSKQEILEYATAHDLSWREDTTNKDRHFLRNRIRHEVLPSANPKFRQEMLALMARQNELREEIEELTSFLLQAVVGPAPQGSSPEDFRAKAENLSVTSEELNRTKLNLLPNNVARELLLEVIFKLTGRRVEQSMLNRILWFVRTARPHKTLQVSGFLELIVTKATVVVRVK